jgi:hypothetical protein
MPEYIRSDSIPNTCIPNNTNICITVSQVVSQSNSNYSIINKINTPRDGGEYGEYDENYRLWWSNAIMSSEKIVHRPRKREILETK